MRKDEIKIEIQKIIDRFPENVLEDIYLKLKELSDESPDSVKLSHNLNKILSEDKELLKRLAQ